jgi:aspartyl aminopeptidase
MTSADFLDFLDKCPTPFQFGSFATSLLSSHGYSELSEDSQWPTIPSKGFLIRDGRTLLAFNIGDAPDSAVIVCTHSDSPCIQLKPQFSDKASAGLQSLRVCVYGWPTSFTWRNRDLRVAGRVYHRVEGGIRATLFDSRKAIAFLAPPIKEETPGKLDVDNDLRPVFAIEGGRSFLEYVAEKIGVSADSITDWDLFLVDAQKPAAVGANKEFVTSRKIDNLGSTFSALTAFVQSRPGKTINILVVFDHEEVGSMTRHGAHGRLIKEFLGRLLGEDFPRVAANSLIVSADNTHGLHPNFAAKHDEMLPAGIGKGVVVKHRLHSEYATTLTTAFPITKAAEHSGVSLSRFLGLVCSGGGSTVGPVLTLWNGIPTVDIGQPQLAMHSAREFIAFADVEAMTKLLTDLYENYEQYTLL